MVTQHSLTSRLRIMMLVSRYGIDSIIPGIIESSFFLIHIILSISSLVVLLHIHLNNNT